MQGSATQRGGVAPRGTTDGTPRLFPRLAPARLAPAFGPIPTGPPHARAGGPPHVGRFTLGPGRLKEGLTSSGRR